MSNENDNEHRPNDKASKDMEAVTDYYEEPDVKGDLALDFLNPQKSEKTSVQLQMDKLKMYELEIGKAEAERRIREALGDLEQALTVFAV